jgi:hypothetical protein
MLSLGLHAGDHPVISGRDGEETTGRALFLCQIVGILAGTRYAPQTAMADDASASPTETRERLCPHCLSLSVVPIGRVVVDHTTVRSAYQCRDCAKQFVVLR